MPPATRMSTRSSAAPDDPAAMSGAPRRLSRRRVLLLIGAGLAALLIAWVPATQPFAGPDEPDHYLRALEIANGHLLGPRVPWLDPSITPTQRAWATKDSRGVSVPPALSPPGRACEDGTPDTGKSACVQPTHTGDYNPLSYVLPAAGLAVSDTAHRGLFLGRAAAVLQCGAFLLLALALIWNGSLWSVLGLLLAMTPMVLFVSSVINPNGLQIAASLAFSAALLRVARDPRRSTGWVWTALAISGAVTILSWQLGPFFMALEVIVLWGALGRTPLLELSLVRRRELIRTGAVLAASLVLYLVWSVYAGQLHSKFLVSPLGTNLQLGAEQLEGVVYQSVGVFGALTIRLPGWSYWVWWGLVAVLGGVAMTLGRRRQRIQLVVVLVVAVAFPVLFYAWIYQYTGFPLQGRYVLPVLALVPLVAGQITGTSMNRLIGLLGCLMMIILAAIQLLAWWTASMNAAGKPHTTWFLSRPAWSPPIGWWPWTLLAVVGTAALVAAAVLEAVGGLRARPASGLPSQAGSATRPVPT